MSSPYQSLNNFILRAPILPLSFFLELTNCRELEESSFKAQCQNPVIKEAVFLASPSLYKEFIKWLESDKSSERMVTSILKYLSRMSSRCTPFGLFAGTAIGQIADGTDIEISPYSHFNRHTRLDMNFLVALSQELTKDTAIRPHLRFSPNNSLYLLADHWRYVEYRYTNSKRSHHIVAVENFPHLEKVIQRAQNGVFIQELKASLVKDGIDLNAAQSFLEDLIENQILISDLEPSVSGPEFLDQIIPILAQIPTASHYLELLHTIKGDIDALDQGIGNNTQRYFDISKKIENLDTFFDLKYLFQTDLVLNTKSNTLSRRLLPKIRKALNLLNRMEVKKANPALEKFKQDFYKRYEEKEVPLAKALDPEIGIGYNADESKIDSSPLLDDLLFPSPSVPLKDSIEIIELTTADKILLRYLLNAQKTGAKAIQLHVKEFEALPEGWNNHSDSLSLLIELIKEDGVEKIDLTFLGSTSGANLISRFCFGDEALQQYSQKIVDLEKRMNPHAVLAEVVHLPESRVGNVLMRPSLRDYEISYLAKTLKDEEHRLDIDDLLVSCPYGSRIVLRSKKLNKEILPKITNAHNYRHDALPIYEFLGSLQMQNKKGGLSFSWGPLEPLFDFFPRIELHNVILSPATWSLKTKELKALRPQSPDNALFLKNWLAFKKEKALPQYVLLEQGDNELLINTENLDCVKMLFSCIRRQERIKLNEFLYDKDTVVTQNQKTSTNQIILTYYNDYKLKKAEAQ